MWEHYSSMFNKYYNIAKNYQTANLNNKCTKNHRVNSNIFSIIVHISQKINSI